MTAPLAIVVDALSFVVAALFALAIRAREPRPDAARRRHLLREIGEGLAVLWAQPVLRALAACGVTANLFVNVYLTVYAIFAIRVLGFPAALFGALAVASGVGGLLGALVATRVARRWGIGPTLVGAQVLAGAGGLAVSLVRGPLALAGLGFAVALVLWDLAVMVYGITAVSLRQAIVPDALQGRVIASTRVVTWGLPAVGFLLGGVLGERIGIRPTILVAGVGLMLSTGWIAFSPTRGIRDLASTPTIRTQGSGRRTE